MVQRYNKKSEPPSDSEKNAICAVENYAANANIGAVKMLTEGEYVEAEGQA